VSVLPNHCDPLTWPNYGAPCPADETIFQWRRNRPETETCSNGFDQTMGFDLLEIIINLFYRQACRTALSAIRRQQQIWA